MGYLRLTIICFSHRDMYLRKIVLSMQTSITCLIVSTKYLETIYIDMIKLKCLKPFSGYSQTSLWFPWWYIIINEFKYCNLINGCRQSPIRKTYALNVKWVLIMYLLNYEAVTKVKIVRYVAFSVRARAKYSLGLELKSVWFNVHLIY